MPPPSAAAASSTHLLQPSTSPAPPCIVSNRRGRRIQLRGVRSSGRTKVGTDRKRATSFLVRKLDLFECFDVSSRESDPCAHRDELVGRRAPDPARRAGNENALRGHGLVRPGDGRADDAQGEFHSGSSTHRCGFPGILLCRAFAGPTGLGRGGCVLGGSSPKAQIIPRDDFGFEPAFGTGRAAWLWAPCLSAERKEGGDLGTPGAACLQGLGDAWRHAPRWEVGGGSFRLKWRRQALRGPRLC